MSLYVLFQLLPHPVLLQLQRVMVLSFHQGMAPAETASEADCLHERRLATNVWGKHYCVLNLTYQLMHFYIQ